MFYRAMQAAGTPPVRHRSMYNYTAEHWYMVRAVKRCQFYGYVGSTNTGVQNEMKRLICSDMVLQKILALI